MCVAQPCGAFQVLSSLKPNEFDDTMDEYAEAIVRVRDRAWDDVRVRTKIRTTRRTIMKRRESQHVHTPQVLTLSFGVPLTP